MFPKSSSGREADDWAAFASRRLLISSARDGVAAGMTALHHRSRAGNFLGYQAFIPKRGSESTSFTANEQNSPHNDGY
jgi:hypothetical protein